MTYDDLYLEGRCPCPTCAGEMIRHEDTPCWCSTSPMPPCSGCENMKIICSDCDWEPGIPISHPSYRLEPKPVRPEHEGTW